METLHMALTLGELAAALKQKHQQPLLSDEEPESNYADLAETTTAISTDTRTDAAKTVKVTFTGEGNQLAVFRWKDTGDANDSSSTVKSESPVGKEESEELSYTEMRLGSQCQSVDEEAVTPTVDVESHYITTHEIQLTELDHDADCDFGRGSRWDYDDDNLVYSFVDYASFESVNEDGMRAKSSQRTDGQSTRPPRLAAAGALVSTESEPCESDKGTSSDESPIKMQDDRLCSTGKVQMAVNACLSTNSPEGEVPPYQMARNSTGVFINSFSKDEALREHTRCFIPAPGRQHLASKSRGKDVNEYSSGASSSVSELDDADKEVRNLTAKSFRSLACPYFDAINLRTSSESSVSEHGLTFNRWSAFVDWNYGSMGRERSTLEATKRIEGKIGNAVTVTSQNSSSESAGKIELNRLQPKRDKASAVTLSETMSVSYNIQSGLATKCTNSAMGSHATASVAIAKPARPLHQGANLPAEVDDGTEDTYKKAIFASSLLKNVISKKMQFEQECKMERGQMQHASPCPPAKEPDSNQNSTAAKVLRRQTSDTGSAQSVASLEELGDMMDSVSHLSEEEAQSSSCTAVAEVSAESPNEAKADPFESQKDPLLCSPNSAFKACKDAEQEILKQHPENDSKPVDMLASTSECIIEKDREGENGKMTKMSHLYVPSSHLQPKGDGAHREASTPTECNQGGKPQEITIHLHSVKENSNPLSSSSLPTPNITHNPIKSHVVSVSDKAPHFMVRDVRDNKWKLQTPIHQVRDVRKLVKSSYRFVSLENTDNKTRPSVSHEESQPVKKEPDKAHFPSPMVIKFQSVNTSGSAQRAAKVGSESLREMEAGRDISQCTRNESMRRVLASKQTEPKLVRQKVECKRTNQAALEKLKAAVKTMEQLYVFDRNEWKRKTEAPKVVSDSHVLSLISSEEHGMPGKTDSEDEKGKVTNLGLHAEKTHMKPVVEIDTSKSLTAKLDSYDSRCMLGQGNSQGSRAAVAAQQGNHSSQKSSSTWKSSSSKGPLCLKISPSISKLEEQRRIVTASETLAKHHHQQPTLHDSENYLTIPVKSCPTEPKHAPQPHPPQSHLPLHRSPVITDSWSPESLTAMMVHQHTPHPQLLCITPPTDAPAPNTQRKLLLDPTTGQCYLVDTPVPLQPTTHRLYYPESGRYVDVPMSVNPIPISPVNLSPTYAPPGYFIYPPTLLPAHSHPQLSTYSEGDGAGSPAGGLYLAPLPGVATSGTKPVISITSQQGPRIIAPPSFDGTTMSFVVEHR